MGKTTSQLARDHRAVRSLIVAGFLLVELSRRRSHLFVSKKVEHILLPPQHRSSQLHYLKLILSCCSWRKFLKFILLVVDADQELALFL
ncbi:MAG: hypothetical protein ACREPR_11965, partial [Brasilonema sp.]